MRVELPFSEAQSLLASWFSLPSFILSVRCDGSTIHADVDLTSIPSTSNAMRLAFAAAGTVVLSARTAGFADGVASFAVTAHARRLPAHKLLPFLLDPITSAMRAAGLPGGLLGVQHGDAHTILTVDLQRLVGSVTRGVTVQNLELRDATFHVDALLRREKRPRA